ncbi:BREX system P-loop protein BrxC [Peribacillus frigoritolerans]|uniref:BREX system P-loop protein BrxC n=1 Tax=Peribacillus frigoritolerans TaxID=450367 RepID=UPI0021A9F61D|nr:BREX system P-loop protein BrxC [Peribacillus frigoritolerans]MCT4479108.1 BREX system P-loop protein BrxC [Peribacillus frigoritolerans]
MLQDAITIKELFKKEIDREINGVVQAGQSDEKVVEEELDEYVMTKEINENMRYFYENYVYSLTHDTTKIGVWISGFFGSGKSHFLKILSYLLNNETAMGKRAVDYFEEKVIDAKLLELMKLASNYENDSILFNIDSKAAAGNKDKAMIVEVFLKVFNEYLGYSSTLWIANMERQLEEEGIYQDFIKQFEKIDGSPWQEVRARVKLKRKSFISALARLGYDEATADGFLKSATNTFEISSTELAQLIASYVNKQDDRFRLTFLVDEIGQYIGDNNDLMLNLQSVVEDIGNYCDGKVWVVVTSQEQLDTVTKISGFEKFSKIQGRFGTKIHLTSSNTDEVIKRRLLDKKPTMADSLKVDFDLSGQSINNTLMFDDKCVLLNGYKDEEDYAAIYPFVPYQVELLQKVFNKVRHQGEAGAHLSRGERSLLNAFQDVAKLLMDKEKNELAPFSSFYDSVKRFLNTAVSSTITNAKQREIEDFDVEVLKVLFMIKGIDEIKATVENITTLMVDSVDCIKNELEKDVKRALVKLRLKLLVSENADRTFVFLSDDEQEMNREIQNENINEANIQSELHKLFFDDVITMRAYSYQKIRNFDFNKFFNIASRGTRSHELTLQVYTGEEYTIDKARLEAHSGNLVLYITEEYVERFYAPMKYAQQITAYASKKMGSGLSDKQRRILEEKRQQVSEFELKAKEALKEAAQNAIYFIQGQEYTFSGTIDTQVNHALEKLVMNTYGKLSYITSPIQVKDADKRISEYALTGIPFELDGQRQNQNAYDDVLRYLDERRGREIINLKSLVEHFSKAPTGWNDLDVIGLVAGLLHDAKIKVSYLSETITADYPQLVSKMMKVSEREKMVIEAVVVVPQRVRKDVLDVMKEAFDFYEVGETYEEISRNIREEVTKQFKEPVTNMLSKKEREDRSYPYPEGTTISRIRSSLDELLSQTNSENLVEEFIDMEEDFSEWSEQLQDIRSFYHGKMIHHFDESVKLLKERHDDLDIANDNSPVQSIKNKIITILTMEKPYTSISDLPILNGQLKEELTNFVKRELAKHVTELESIHKKMKVLLTSYDVDAIKELVIKHITELENRIEQLKNTERISQVYVYRQSAETSYDRLNTRVKELWEEYKDGEDDPTELVTFKSSQLLKEEVTITNGHELNELMEEMKKELLLQLQLGKHIKITKE